MYEPHCGLDNLMMSWGHDEYLYRFLKFNNAKLPEEALYMIRCEFLISEILKGTNSFYSATSCIN